MLRVPVRLLAVLAATCALSALWFLLVLPALLIRRRRGWRDCIMHWWSRAICAIIRIRVRCSGPMPVPGCLLVSNHLSYLDIIVLCAQCRCTFVSKADVKSWPLVGWMAWAMGVLFLERENKRELPRVAAALEQELAGGSRVVLFPEGTSGDGSRVMPFRSSLLAPVAGRAVPIVVATLHYRTPEGSPPAREAVCWWGSMTFAPHARRLIGLPRIDARVQFAAPLLGGADRKRLAAELWVVADTQLRQLQRD